jgi:hypothetical protein
MASHSTFDASFPESIPDDHPPGATFRPVVDAPGPPASAAEPALQFDASVVIDGLLGEGGMGVVFHARQPSIGREVAVKRLRDRLPAGAAAALDREARFMGRLEHPNLIPVHAVGRDERGLPAILMKKVDGVAWSALLRDPRHPWWDAENTRDRLDRHLDILADVGRALEFAHARGVLHRDVKPENVLIGAFGEVYLADWGVATELEGAVARGPVGTPVYLAPEALRPGATLDARIDVYLLGGCLFEVLTGSPPHPGDTLPVVLDAARAGAIGPMPDTVRPELAAIARRALAADPNDRFVDVRAFREALADAGRQHAANRLADAAAARLDAIRAGSPEAWVEARFGFRQALQLAPENPRARDGLRAAATAVFDRALLADDVATAADALRALEPDGDAARRDALAAAEARVAAARARATELDPTTAAAARDLGAVTLGVVAAGMTALAWAMTLSTPADGFGYRESMLILGASELFAVGVVVALRDRIRPSLFNRAAALYMLVPSVPIAAHRWAAWTVKMPLDLMFRTDLAILGAGAIGLWALDRRLLWSVAPLALGYSGIVLWPSHAIFWFGAALPAGALWVVLLSRWVASRPGE